MQQLPLPQYGFIYAIGSTLKPEEFRYVGRTSFPPEKRLYQHLNRNKNRTAKDKWLNKIASKGETVRMVILETCPTETINEREIHWIAKLRTDGHRLMNGTRGGDGVVQMTPEAKANLSEALRKIKRTDEFKKKVSLANQGKTLTPEHRAKIAASLEGKKRPQDTIEKMRKAALGNTYKRDWLSKKTSESIPSGFCQTLTIS